MIFIAKNRVKSRLRLLYQTEYRGPYTSVLSICNNHLSLWKHIYNGYYIYYAIGLSDSYYNMSFLKYDTDAVYLNLISKEEFYKGIEEIILKKALDKLIKM